jgi:hypothetical protein
LPDIPPFTDHITSVLSQERTRIKDVLNKSLPPSTRATLLKLLELDDTFTDLAKLKKMSKDFSVNQIKKELKTHRKIKAIYSELKVVVNQLELSPKNLEYYASLVRHKSSFRLRRHADEQSILYLVCYLFFRYRETNDNLVSAFSYLVRKLSESSKSYGKHKVADDLEIVRNNLKVAGNLLSFFIESEISDDMAFGDIRKKAFKLLSKDKIRLLSSHLDNNDFDTRQYEWEYIDRQTSK